MYETWLRPNRRALLLGCVPPLIVACIGGWLACAPPISAGDFWRATGLFLIAASVAMQAARKSVQGGNVAGSFKGLLVGGLLTLAFLGGQLYAWALVRNSEFFSPLNPAVAFFYLLTAVHGLHLLGGLYVWGRTLARMRRENVEVIDVRLSVELCSVYWHFLLLVWLGLFAVMLST